MKALRAVGKQLTFERYVHVAGTDIQPKVGESGQLGEGGQSSQSQTPLHLSTVVGPELHPIRLGVSFVDEQFFLGNQVATVRAAPAQMAPVYGLQVGKKHLQVQLLVVVMAVWRKGKSVWLIKKLIRIVY